MASDASSHQTVFLAETISYLAPGSRGSYVDATVGFGFASEAILEACGPDGRLLALDVDPVAIEASGARLARFEDRCAVVHGSYAELGELADEAGFGQIDGVLIDAGGVSREQIMNPERGLSFQVEGRLDMRLNPGAPGPDAAELVATLSPAELARMFKNAGEAPRKARAMARAVVQRRSESPIDTTTDLAEIIKKSVKSVGARRGVAHEATRAFLGLRLAVNRELETLEAGIREAVDRLSPTGRLIVLTYHGSEHRLVRGVLRDMERGCECPPDLPVCGCGHEPLVTRWPRKP